MQTLEGMQDHQHQPPSIQGLDQNNLYNPFSQQPLPINSGVNTNLVNPKLEL